MCSNTGRALGRSNRVSSLVSALQALWSKLKCGRGLTTPGRGCAEPPALFPRTRIGLHAIYSKFEPGTCLYVATCFVKRFFAHSQTRLNWQYLLASEKLSKDPRSGQFLRQHIHRSSFSRKFTSAVLPLTPQSPLPEYEVVRSTLDGTSRT